jgi:outer membrane protein assembly factor BamA
MQRFLRAILSFVYVLVIAEMMHGQSDKLLLRPLLADSVDMKHLRVNDSLRHNPSQAYLVFSEQDKYVDTVIVIGNKVTKDYIILREMELKPGVKISEEALEFDKSRVYSLGLFTRVDIFLGRIAGGRATLIVDVSERFFLFPWPIFGIKDRDWSKLYYGLGVYHTNFRGRNERVSLSFALGYDPWVRVAYQNPVLNRESNLFLETEFRYAKERNKSLVSLQGGSDFDEIYYEGAVTLGKRLSLYHMVWAKAGYQVLEVPENNSGRTISTNGIDRSLRLGLGVSYDTRDLREYPLQGTYAQAVFNKYGFGESVVDYTRLDLDFSRYVPLLTTITVAGRVFTSIACGPIIPNYGHVYFGYGERIRGHFDTVLEGDNLLGGSLELRAPIIRPGYLTWEDAPYPEIATLKYGLFLTLFADIGATWYKDENPTQKRTTSGLGAGLNFILPYSAVFRTEYAFDERFTGQWIFDLRVSF